MMLAPFCRCRNQGIHLQELTQILQLVTHNTAVNWGFGGPGCASRVLPSTFKSVREGIEVDKNCESKLGVSCVHKKMPVQTSRVVIAHDGPPQAAQASGGRLASRSRLPRRGWQSVELGNVPVTLPSDPISAVS